MTDSAAHLKFARRLANLLDAKWNILGIQFGIDPLFDFIPGITSLLPSFLSFYIVYIALKLEVPSSVLGKILTNILIDYFIGIIPILGFIGDIFFKSNIRNLTLLETYLDQRDHSGILQGKILD